MRGAIVALCTFCDSHGPRVCFCSHGWNAHQRRDLLASSPLSDSKSCEGCRSLPKQKRFLMSEDPSNRTLFASGNIDDHPDQAIRFSLQNIAKRCFSVEALGPSKNHDPDCFFAFSETSTSSLVLVKNFIVPDNQYLRGFKRKYCLAVALSDSSNLVESVAIIRREMREIIKSIKCQADHRFKSAPNTSVLVDHLRNRTNTFPLRNLSVVLERLDLYHWLHYKFLGILNGLFHYKTESHISSALATCLTIKVPTWDELKSAFRDDDIIFAVIRAALTGLSFKIVSQDPMDVRKYQDMLKVFLPNPSKEWKIEDVGIPSNKESILVHVDIEQSQIECRNCFISVPELTSQMKALLRSSSLPRGVRLFQINRLKQEVKSMSIENA